MKVIMEEKMLPIIIIKLCFKVASSVIKRRLCCKWQCINLLCKKYLRVLPVPEEKGRILLSRGITLVLHQHSLTFFPFKQAKKRDEILQLLRKQREERISVRLTEASGYTYLKGESGKFSEVSQIDPLNAAPQSLPWNLLYTGEGGEVNPWETRISPQFAALLEFHGMLLSVQFFVYIL